MKLKRITAVFCALSLAVCPVFAADTQAPVKVEYAQIEELVKSNDTSYHIALMELEQTKNMYYDSESAYYDAQSIIGAGSIAESAAAMQFMPTQSQRTTLKDAVADKQKAVEDFIISEIFTAQRAYRNYFDMTAQKALAEENLAVLKEKYSNIKLKYERGMASSKNVDDAWKTVTDQTDFVTTIDNAIRDNLNAFKILLNIPLSKQVIFTEPPELDLSLIENMKYETDLEKYLENNKTILAYQRVHEQRQRESKWTYADKNKAKLDLEKAKSDARLAFETMFNGLIKANDDYRKAETDLLKDEQDLIKLKKKLDSGIVSKTRYNDTENLVKAARQNVATQKLNLYFRTAAYFNSLDGIPGMI